MLQLHKVTACYKNVRALAEVTLKVEKGEIVTLIGPNGAGKSTVLKTISGLIRVEKGSIRYVGEDIRNMATEKIITKGISHVPEG